METWEGGGHHCDEKKCKNHDLRHRETDISNHSPGLRVWRLVFFRGKNHDPRHITLATINLIKPLFSHVKPKKLRHRTLIGTWMNRRHAPKVSIPSYCNLVKRFSLWSLFRYEGMQ